MAVVKCVIDISGSSIITTDYWLVWDLRGMLLAQPYVAWVYHVGNTWCIFIPDLHSYVVGPTYFDKQGDLVRVYMVLPVVDFYVPLSWWSENSEARVRLLPT